jgi:hypothetical protein
VHGDEASTADTDGTDLPSTCFPDVKPNTCGAGHAFGTEIEASKEADNGLLEGLDVCTQSEVQWLKVKDGVTGDLAGPVIRNVSASVRVVEGDATPTEKVLRDEQIGV